MKQYLTKKSIYNFDNKTIFTLLCCKKVIQLYKNSKQLYKIQSWCSSLLCRLIRHSFIHVFLMSSVRLLLVLLFLRGKNKTKKFKIKAVVFTHKPPKLRGTL